MAGNGGKYLMAALVPLTFALLYQLTFGGSTVKLAGKEQLTFRADKMTTEGIPQLQCIAERYACFITFNEIRCHTNGKGEFECRPYIFGWIKWGILKNAVIDSDTEVVHSLNGTETKVVVKGSCHVKYNSEVFVRNLFAMVGSLVVCFCLWYLRGDFHVDEISASTGNSEETENSSLPPSPPMSKRFCWKRCTLYMGGIVIFALYQFISNDRS